MLLAPEEPPGLGLGLAVLTCWSKPGSPKSLGSLGAGTSAPDFFGIHPVIVEILQSGPNWSASGHCYPWSHAACVANNLFPENSARTVKSSLLLTECLLIPLQGTVVF